MRKKELSIRIVDNPLKVSVTKRSYASWETSKSTKKLLLLVCQAGPTSQRGRRTTAARPAKQMNFENNFRSDAARSSRQRRPVEIDEASSDPT